MNSVPQPKKSVLIKAADEEKRIVSFEATDEIAGLIRQHQFGALAFDEQVCEYTLAVSQRFEFREIADWLGELAA